jgi:hypothetical protein
MNEDLRMRSLRRVLLFKVFVTIVVWGLPALAAPLSLLEFLKLPVPLESIYLRLFGGAAIAWGVAYWFAYKEPSANRAILQAGLVDNALPTIVVAWYGITGGHSSVFMWISGLLTGFFFLAFLVLMPQASHKIASAEPGG